MNRVIMFVALSLASFLAAYAEGAVDVPWSFSDVSAAPANGVAAEAMVAEQARSDALAQRRAIWHWAAAH
jgi:hypothetical protein